MVGTIIVSIAYISKVKTIKKIEKEKIQLQQKIDSLNHQIIVRDLYYDRVRLLVN
jgi:hypothetical protein